MEHCWPAMWFRLLPDWTQAREQGEMAAAVKVQVLVEPAMWDQFWLLPAAVAGVAADREWWFQTIRAPRSETQAAVKARSLCPLAAETSQDWEAPVEAQESVMGTGPAAAWRARVQEPENPVPAVARTRMRAGGSHPPPDPAGPATPPVVLLQCLAFL